MFLSLEILYLIILYLLDRANHIIVISRLIELLPRLMKQLKMASKVGVVWCGILKRTTKPSERKPRKLVKHKPQFLHLSSYTIHNGSGQQHIPICNWMWALNQKESLNQESILSLMVFKLGHLQSGSVRKLSKGEESPGVLRDSFWIFQFHLNSFLKLACDCFHNNTSSIIILPHPKSCYELQTPLDTSMEAFTTDKAQNTFRNFHLSLLVNIFKSTECGV